MRAVDTSVMDVPAALEYGPGMARPACIAVTQLFLYSATFADGLQRVRNSRPREEESIALRSEVRVDANVIASDHHSVVSIGHCRHGVESSRRRDERRVAVVSRGPVCTRGSAKHALSILIRAVTSTFRALRGTAINGYPGPRLDVLGRRTRVEADRMHSRWKRSSGESAGPVGW